MRVFHSEIALVLISFYFVSMHNTSNKKSNPIYWLAVLPPLFWAGNFIIGKLILIDIPPIHLSFFRWLTCSIILLPFSYRVFINSKAVIRSNLPKILVFSLLGIVGFNCFVYLGLVKTSAINAAIINSSMPIVTLILAVFIVGEPLTRNRLAGVALVLLGIIWISFEGNIQRLSTFSFEPGDVFVLLGVLCWALYTVLARRWPVAIPLTNFVFLISAIGTLVHIPFLFLEHSPSLKSYSDPATFISIIYLGIFPSFMAYIFWVKAIQRMGPGKTSLFMYFMPVFSTILAVVFLKEQIFVYHLIGFWLIASGLYVAMRLTK